jgi:uncharacterized protein HemX
MLVVITKKKIMTLTLLSIWVWMKKHWKIFLVVLEAIIGVVLFIFLQKKNNNVFADKLEEINTNHKDEIDKINNAREVERQQYKQNEENLQKQLTEIKTHYTQQINTLDTKTNKIIDDASKKYANDPQALSVELAKKLGVELYVPKETK